jgi:hypothetical protein
MIDDDCWLLVGIGCVLGKQGFGTSDIERGRVRILMFGEGVLYKLF